MVATAEAFKRGVIRAREAIQNAYNWTFRVREGESDTPADGEGPMDYEGRFGIGFGEQEGSEGRDGPGAGGDFGFEGEVFEFRLIEVGSGAPFGPAEYGEVGEEGRYHRGDDHDEPNGGSN